jgi:hypothetical protein
MGLRQRILRVVAPASGGPRKRSVLEGLARTERQRRGFDQVLKGMLEARELVMYGDRKGARYGLPRRPGRPAATREGR